VLNGVKAGAFGKHPAGEDPLHFAGQLLLVDFDKGGRMRRLGRRAGVADPRRHLERAELDRMVDRNFEMRDAPGHLVEGGEDGNRVLDDIGLGDARAKA
jgi:hypothetical protein